MIVVDVVVIAILVLAVALGLRRGLLATVGTLVGLVAGGCAALLLLPLIDQVVPAHAWRYVLVLLVCGVLLSVGATLGGMLGARVGRGVARLRLGVVDRVLGGALGLVVAALAVSLVGQSIAAAGVPGISSALSSSVVLRTIEQLTPRPVVTTLAELRGTVLGQGLPQIGRLFAIEPADTLPDVDLDDPVLRAAAESVARVSGVAYACGTSSTGSGFVAAPDRIVTNAHVVAGVGTPLIELPGGAVREGRVVYFDATDDLAVIAVDDLGAASLPVVPTLPPGTDAVVQGYPHGGPFTSGPARVMAVGPANVADIYGESPSSRDVYALSASIRPGNSGGPLLTRAGEVAGVVFARDQLDDSLGYALTPAEFLPVIAGASELSSPVSTGACT